MKIRVLISVLLFAGLPTVSYGEDKCSSIAKDDILQCINENYIKSDKQLNQVYQNIKTNTPNKNYIKLRNVQRTWLKTILPSCNIYKQSAYGEESEIYEAMCRKQQLDERARELKLIQNYPKNSIIRNKDNLYEIKSLFYEYPLEWREYIKMHCDYMEEIFDDEDCFSRNVLNHRVDFG